MKRATVRLTAMLVAAFVGGRAEGDPPAARIRVAILQMALAQTIGENRDRMVAGIAQAAARGARVAVFPEGALRGKDGDDRVVVNEAIDVLRRATRERRLYLLFGGSTFSAKLNKEANWMRVLGPDGGDVFHYEKLYDHHGASMPGVFYIDGTPCSAVICADRWLRGVEELPIQQGAQISFELSSNFASEWIAPFEWYWYVPRALRNQAWVIFANTGNRLSGVPDDAASPAELRHGHSAVIAPDGGIAAAAHHDAETIVIAEVEVARATRAAALARSAHPALRRFWDAGLRLHRGETIDAPSLTPLTSTRTNLTIAVAQVTGEVSVMAAMIGQARARKADLVIFPARAAPVTALARFQAASRQHGVTVVIGMEHEMHGQRRNAAFVIGPDGALLTRYDQLSAAKPFAPGADPATMWFRVKGVPAVVTLGADALWTELAELAAVAGAQVHLHLDHDVVRSQDASLRRLQGWLNLASYQTFCATVNVVGSALWDDLRDQEERQAEVRGLPRPDTGSVEVYSPFSANLITRAGTGRELIVATRTVGPRNSYHPRRTSRFNPQMDAWYRLGAAMIGPNTTTRR